MFRRNFFPALVPALALLGLACDRVDRPDKPLPDDFSAVTLTGDVIDRPALRGRPWVINVWLPG